jgi:hypothetical protein
MPKGRDQLETMGGRKVEMVNKVLKSYKSMRKII